MGNLTNKDYDKIVKKASPNSRIFLDITLAFIIGGAICVVGQIILDFLLRRGFSVLDSSTITSVTMIFLGALLTALNIYGDIAKYGGAGTLVPITGFANSITACAMEFKSEGYVAGMATKMFIIAGPVLVFGEISSFVCGILYYFYLMFFK